MAANTPDPATRAIITFLSENPGLHGLDAIAEAASVSKPIAGKVLRHLVDSNPPMVRLEQSDPKNKQWAWALSTPKEPEAPAADQPSSTGTELAGDKAAVTPEPVATKGDRTTKDEAASGDGNGGASSVASKAPDSPPEHDADQVIMHAARTLATSKNPTTTAEIAAAGYLSAKSLHLLTALRALAFHGLIECSKPFEPDAPDCTWQWNGKDAMELFSKAATVDLGDAPDSQTCPTCGTARAIPGIAKDRKRGGNVRLDGKTRLGNNELADLVKAWIEKPENAGELIKPIQLGHELRAVHGDRLAKATYGSISKAMAKLTEFDPAHKDRPPLLTLESDKPITYRIRDRD